MKATFFKYFKIFNYILAFCLILFFSYKAFVWYKLANQVKPKDEKINLGQYIERQKIGIKEVKNSKYFYGKDINNYLWYNGRLWQIVKANNNGILIITEESQTSINWGEKKDFINSNIYQWLNYDVFYRTVNDLTGLRSNYRFELLHESDYKNTGAENGFINDGKFFYLINDKEDLKYVTPDGMVKTTNDGNLGLGIRPTINLRKDIMINGGDGSKANPLIIGQRDNLIDKKINYAQVGDYVNYKGYLWRINFKDNNIKLITDGFLHNKENIIITNYGDSNNFKKSNVLALLKNNINEKNLLTWNYYIDQYGISNNYSINFKNIEKTKLGIPSIGDLFASGEDQDYFLTNPGDTDDVIMVIQKNNILFTDDINNSLAIKATVKIPNDLIIKSGMGTFTEPYVIN